MLGEKPAAQTVAEALSLAAAAEATGKLFMVSQSRRYNDQLVAFRQHVRDLGAVGGLTTRFAKAPHFGGFREEMDDVLLLDMAIHAFDSARYLLERDPVSVYCESWNPSWSWYRGDAAAAAVFAFEDGVRYVYDGSWCAPGAETSWNGAWRASGAAGTALWDGDHDPSSDLDGTARLARAAAPTRSGTRSPGRWRRSSGRSAPASVPDGEVHGNVMSLAMVEAAIASARSGPRGSSSTRCSSRHTGTPSPPSGRRDPRPPGRVGVGPRRPARAAARFVSRNGRVAHRDPTVPAHHVRYDAPRAGLEARGDAATGLQPAFCGDPGPTRARWGRRRLRCPGARTTVVGQ